MTSSTDWKGKEGNAPEPRADRSIPQRPLITLTTDFGTTSPYVAAMKGVILTQYPPVNLIDLTHAIPPQDVMHAAYYLRDAVPWFPAGTIHVVVVDPGVGTSRLPLGVVINDQHIICPDNGLWTLIESKSTPTVYHLSNKSYHLSETSHTFHGRDVFAPCAAALAAGISLDELGHRIFQWQRVALPAWRLEQNVLHGEVVFIDDFGNLITNIPAEMLTHGLASVQISNQIITTLVKTYGEASSGQLVALFSSNGHLEIAEVNGNAARRLNVIRGEIVRCTDDMRQFTSNG